MLQLYPIPCPLVCSSYTLQRLDLLKLMVPRFHGDVTVLTTFWDLFKEAVHDNTELTKIDKFNYLTSFLESVTAHSI